MSDERGKRGEREERKASIPTFSCPFLATLFPLPSDGSGMKEWREEDEMDHRPREDGSRVYSFIHLPLPHHSSEWEENGKGTAKIKTRKEEKGKIKAS